MPASQGSCSPSPRNVRAAESATHASREAQIPPSIPSARDSRSRARTPAGQGWMFLARIWQRVAPLVPSPGLGVLRKPARWCFGNAEGFSRQVQHQELDFAAPPQHFGTGLGSGFAFNPCKVHGAAFLPLRSCCHPAAEGKDLGWLQPWIHKEQHRASPRQPQPILGSRRSCHPQTWRAPAGHRGATCASPKLVAWNSGGIRLSNPAKPAGKGCPGCGAAKRSSTRGFHSTWSRSPAADPRVARGDTCVDGL